MSSPSPEQPHSLQHTTTINNSIHNDNILNTQPSTTIMEKDKQIISLSKTTKELSQHIETMNTQLQSKQYEIISLQTEITSLKLDQNIYENKIVQLSNQVNTLSLDNDINNAKNESEQLSKQNHIQQITEAFNTQIKDYEDITYQYECLQKENLHLKQEINNATQTIQSLQNVIFELKQDNKKVFILNKTIKEKDDVINTLNNNNEILKCNYNEVVKENNNLLKKVTSLSKASEYLDIINKSGSNGLINTTLSQIKLNHKIQIEQKEKEYNELKRNYDKIIKDNDSLIAFIIESIQFMETQVENVLQGNSKWNEVNKDNYSEIKFGLVKKNFDIVVNNIIEKINSIQRSYSVIKELYERERNKVNEIHKVIEMKESVINKYETDIGLLKNDVHSKQIEINDINSKLNTIIKTNDNLYQDNLALKNESVKYQTFISTYITKIINTLVNITHIQPKQIINNENDSDTTDNNTLPFINLDNYLSQLQIQFDSETNASKNKIETLEQEISKLEDENKQMKSQMNTDKLYQDKIDLNMKLQEISEVLKESNKLLDECNKENTHLKDKIISLEHDKQRLTQENEELRETISYYTNQNYKEQLADIKQQLKQTQHDNEFLCIQNKTLETLVKQLKNKTHTNKNKQQQQIHQKHNTFQNEIFTFGRDDYLKEKELNDILNKYSYDIYLNQMNQNHLISNNSFESLKLNPSSSQMFHSPIDDTI